MGWLHALHACSVQAVTSEIGIGTGGWIVSSGMMRNVYRARVVMPMDGPEIADGVVACEGGVISWVGRAVDWTGGGPVTDLGEVVLLPGLINAHCHLDYTVMRGAILERSSFSGWVRRINELKRTLTDEDYLASIAAGFAELRRNGTTTVLNIEAFPELMVRMPPPPIRTWWFYEMLDVRSRVLTEEVVAGALSFFEARPSWRGGFGLSPHAPYTASLELYGLARVCAEQTGMLVTTHLAESEEEVAMFARREGRLFEFLAGIGRDMGDTGGRSPIAHLLKSDVLPRGAILVHMNHLLPGDADLLRARAGDFAIVHCPNCHAYFGRPPFPYELYRSLGLRVSLGTDSAASNRELNLFAEMRTFQRNFPGVGPTEILRMVTLHPAAALRKTGQLGVLRSGAAADMIAVPFGGSVGEASAAVVGFEGAVLPVFRGFGE